MYNAVAVDLTSQVFWRVPFVSLCEQRQLVEFFVVQIEPTSVVNNKVVVFLKCSMWCIHHVVPIG